MHKPFAFALAIVAGAALPLAAAVLAAGLATGLAGAAWAGQAGGDAEAADKTRGMALMGADIRYYDGALRSGAGAVSSTRVEAGRYQITFVRNIEDCYVVATTYDAGVGRGYALTWLQSGSTVTVLTCNPAINCSNTTVDHSFHLIAFCPK